MGEVDGDCGVRGRLDDPVHRVYRVLVPEQRRGREQDPWGVVFFFLIVEKSSETFT